MLLWNLPYFLYVALPIIVLGFIASSWVKRTYQRYSQVRNASGLAGVDVARRILAGAGLSDVTVQVIDGELSDNYDPRNKTLNLSRAVASGTSVAAEAVVAHEIGHALQDHQGFFAMRIRSGLVPAANLGSQAGPLIVIAGLLLSVFTGRGFGFYVALAGLFLFAAVVLFQLVTTPVELDASRRALRLLAENGVIVPQEQEGARRMLRPAAFATADPAEVLTRLTAAGEAPYRADQARQWFWQRLVASFEAMRTLPPSARRRLAEAFAFSTVAPQLKRAADRGQTVKYLFKLADAKTIETVVMHYEASARSRARTTICVSSQVGCPIGCSFCATGQSGFDRNLSEAEIVDQFLAAIRDLGEMQRSLTNVVFMGMGEPLNNYAAVVGAIRRWARPDTLNFSPRRVTVSTIGLVPFIERLSAEGLPVNLAISLHAPDDALRSSMIPVNRKYPIAAIVGAARAHAERTGR